MQVMKKNNFNLSNGCICVLYAIIFQYESNITYVLFMNEHVTLLGQNVRSKWGHDKFLIKRGFYPASEEERGAIFIIMGN